MKFDRRVWLLAACIITALASPLALAQDYPNKAINFVVPFPPGGSNDVLARLRAEQLSKAFGQPVVVSNKPGAAGNIGTDFTAKAAPDGYTIAVAPNQTVSVSPVLYRKLPFDAAKDLQGITLVGRVPMLLVVSSKVNAKSVAELIAQMKASLGKFSYASAGSGSPQHKPAHSAQRHRGRGSEGEEPQQVAHPLASGARVRRGRAAVGLWQGALPRPGQERHARVHSPGTGQHLPQPTTVDGTGAPMRAANEPKGPDSKPNGPQQRALGNLFGPDRPVINPLGSFDRAYSAQP